LDVSIFFEEVRLTVVTCEENEKRYFLSTPLFIDMNSIRVNGPFNINNEIIGNSQGLINTRKFIINNEKYDYTIEKNGKTVKNIKGNFYPYTNIIFPLYFLTESRIIITYDEYKRTIRNCGFIAKGYMNDGAIIFVINEKNKVSSTYE
jgi:hypothetical protein